jgi:hypothetical protein
MVKTKKRAHALYKGKEGRSHTEDRPGTSETHATGRWGAPPVQIDDTCVRLPSLPSTPAKEHRCSWEEIEKAEMRT